MKSNEIEEGEAHGAEAFIELLPDDQVDDPLLAVACQLVVMIVDGEIEKGEPVATINVIFERSFNMVSKKKKSTKPSIIS